MEIRQGNKLIKEETCHFDERGQVEVTPMKDAYDKIRRSYRKTHIPRNIRADERHSEVVEDTFFDDSLKYHEEDSQDEINPYEAIKGSY